MSHWQAEFISCNFSPVDQNTKLNAFYVGQQLFFHFMLMGGAPGDKITVNADIIINDQLISTQTVDTSIGNGSGFYISVIPNVAGKVEIKLFYKTAGGERCDLQGAYAYVHNAVNKQAEKKNKKKEPGFIWVILLVVLIFVVYLAATNKIQIPGFNYLTGSGNTAVSTSGSSSSSSSRSSSSSSSTARSGNSLEGTTWKYVKDGVSQGTVSFSNGTCIMTPTFGERTVTRGKYTIHGNKLECSEVFGEYSVQWEIVGNQLILTIEGLETVWDRQ